jgi:hypothetical protein
MDRGGSKASASEDRGRSGNAGSGSVAGGRGGRVRTVAVRDPLPDIARHVVQAKAVGSKPADRGVYYIAIVQSGLVAPAKRSARATSA